VLRSEASIYHRLGFRLRGRAKGSTACRAKSAETVQEKIETDEWGDPISKVAGSSERFLEPTA
jgi:hypothetical protein